MTQKSLFFKRNIYLVTGITAMLFSGVLYAWSILKIPFVEEFQWDASLLAFNFTLTMCFFCIGAFLGSLLCKRINLFLTLLISSVFTGIGFIITGFLSADNPYFLFITYGFLAATGIGISYNVIVSNVTSWFPDKKGFSSGCLMLGFGLSTLILGNLIDKLYSIESFGWRKTFIVLGIILFIVLFLAGIILKKPQENTVFPENTKIQNNSENIISKDYSPLEMLKNFTFIRAFICMTFLTAVGNSAISFARDLALSVDATESFATNIVGILAVCNGLGRILTGIIFDKAGRKTAMYSANIVTVAAAGITLISVLIGSLPLLTAGLCLTGISYGSCPTVTSAFTSQFYGRKYFSINYSLMNFNLIFASFIAGLSNTLFINSGNYITSFIMLVILSVAAMGLNLTIKRP